MNHRMQWRAEPKTPEPGGWLTWREGEGPANSGPATDDELGAACDDSPYPTLEIAQTRDFEPTGDGATDAWSRTEWVPLPRVGPGKSTYTTRVKKLYSSQAIHLLFDCEDQCLSTNMTRDGDDLWKGDALEIFLWPSEATPLYLQYDLSPLGAELALLVPGTRGGGIGWSPWQYTGPRRVAARTTVRGGERAAHAAVSGWMAEIRIPFALLHGIASIPSPGSQWRANFYRVDYDLGSASHWAWCPRTGTSTHAYQHYGILHFGGAA